MYNLEICHLYPNLLNLYGDRGNIIALKQRADWRGIGINIHNVSLGQEYDPSKYDITFLGGGQDFEQEIIQEDLIKLKGGSITSAIHSGKVFLAICGGYQLLGKYYTTYDGRKIDLLGALDFWTIAQKDRLIGNFAFRCDFLKSSSFDGVVVGFENHAGRTFLGERVQPMGKLICGHGNNGQDGFEGAVFKNTFCSYSHGSLLPKNPKLTDHILSVALGNKYPSFNILTPLDDSIENKARLSVLNKYIR
ncbi:MAG: glutamine amidotransferase [Clostridiales bacterium]|nr:glutamine amidotransferase [Clostridiales bacterium]